MGSPLQEFICKYSWSLVLNGPLFLTPWHKQQEEKKQNCADIDSRSLRGGTSYHSGIRGRLKHYFRNPSPAWQSAASQTPLHQQIAGCSQIAAVKGNVVNVLL